MVAMKEAGKLDHTVVFMQTLLLPLAYVGMGKGSSSMTSRRAWDAYATNIFLHSCSAANGRSRQAHGARPPTTSTKRTPSYR